MKRSTFLKSLIAAPAAIAVEIQAEPPESNREKVKGLINEQLDRYHAQVKAEHYANMFNIGVLSPNDIRRLENMGPDKYPG